METMSGVMQVDKKDRETGVSPVGEVTYDRTRFIRIHNPVGEDIISTGERIGDSSFVLVDRRHLRSRTPRWLSFLPGRLFSRKNSE